MPAAWSCHTPLTVSSTDISPTRAQIFSWVRSCGSYYDHGNLARNHQGGNFEEQDLLLTSPGGGLACLGATEQGHGERGREYGALPLLVFEGKVAKVSRVHSLLANSEHKSWN